MRGLRTRGGRNPKLASRRTDARTSPKGRARGRPVFQLALPPPGPQPGPGPGPLRGGGLERDARRRAPPGAALAGGHTRFRPSRPPRHWSQAAPVPAHPGAGSFYPRFPPWSSAGARASAVLRVQTREAPAAAATGAEPSVPGSRAPLPSPAGPHAAARTLGPQSASLAPQPGSYLRPCGSGPGPARRELGFAGGRGRADGQRTATAGSGGGGR